MSLDIPTTEPAELTAGDTWTWQKSLVDFPAGTWTLAYHLRGINGEIDITAAASGIDHLVSVAKATTAAYKAGRYGWTAVVTSSTERRTLATGELVVKPDPAQTGKGNDPRSHARKALEAIEAVIENRATVDQQEYTIGSRSLKRMTVGEITKWRDYYVAQVFAEDNKRRREKGYNAGRLVAKL